ncbi:MULTISPECIES: hypothetical protein [Enterobacter]|uniref:hypothetical protein n=1 Tax=Enterobacter TaxID=547 RepID=UPI0028EBB949|nr:hypothetical protein [Enterobacter cloacae]WNT38530.1 hypothetical protein RRL13_10650 [Enterobacter cloacae]HDR2796284.1 hypothetical protein [Enterobacter asburiae]HDR2801706.1 hypothetical protein [Enterobacter asburiae]
MLILLIIVIVVTAVVNKPTEAEKKQKEAKELSVKKIDELRGRVRTTLECRSSTKVPRIFFLTRKDGWEAMVTSMPCRNLAQKSLILSNNSALFASKIKTAK